MTTSIRRELMIALIVTLLCLALLPGLIFLVGRQLFGVYQAGLAGIYAAHWQGLLQLQWPAWLLTFAPALCVLLLRLIRRLTATRETTPHPTPPIRREPGLGA